MNISNNLTTSSLFNYNTGYFVLEVFGYYVIPITSLIGAILRFIFVIGIYNTNLTKMPKYYLLFYKILFTFLSHSVLILYQNSGCIGCPDRRFNPYWSKVYELYFFQFINNIFRIGVMVFEVLITFDRFCVLRVKKSFLSFAKIRIVFCMTLIFATLAQIHVVFGQVIAYSEINKLYYLATTQVGQSKWFFLYQVVLTSSIRFGTIFSILIFNILNFIEYKKFIRDKKKVVKDIDKIKYEVTFTRMILIATSLFAIGIIFISCAIILSQINQIKKITYDLFTNFFIAMSQEFILLVLIVDIFLYVFMDDNLRKNLKKVFFRTTILTEYTI